MSVWAIADLHLSFGVPDKHMDVFGENWVGYTEKIAKSWRTLITDEDLVLIPGDISWAMSPEQARPDLEWIHLLPGTKVILKGNHDYWWTSLSKVEKVLPSSIHLIQNNAFQWQNVSVAGTRLWDTPEYNFNKYINYQVNTRAKPLTAIDKDPNEAKRIFERELGRLESSLKCLDQTPNVIRIVMTHYPPISAELEDSQVSSLLEKYNVNICVFGHLHNVKKDINMFGEKNRIRYLLVACDYLDDFTPLKLC